MRTVLYAPAVTVPLFATACGGSDPSAGAPAVDDSETVTQTSVSIHPGGTQVQIGTTPLAEQRAETAARLSQSPTFNTDPGRQNRTGPSR
jgi:hypothetical protein